MRRKNLMLVGLLAVALTAAAREVPDWTPAQQEFLKMSPAERRAKFEDKAWHATVCSGFKWREAKEGESSRFVHLEKVPNMRDFGGMKLLGGGEIRSGVLYRSAGINNNPKFHTITNADGKIEREYYGRGADRVTDVGRAYAVKTLGIKTDLDLRSPGECNEMTGSPLGSEVKWINVSFHAYNGLFSEVGKAAFKQAFAVLIDRQNYPLVFHCIGGADRTGTLAYIVGALVGVSDADLQDDWELTALCHGSTGFVHKWRYDKLVQGFVKKYPGATTKERVEAFVREQGFTDENIAAFRSILISPLH